jgi:hypothetical protein
LNLRPLGYEKYARRLNRSRAWHRTLVYLRRGRQPVSRCLTRRRAARCVLVTGLVTARRAIVRTNRTARESRKKAAARLIAGKDHAVTPGGHLQPAPRCYSASPPAVRHFCAETGGQRIREGGDSGDTCPRGLSPKITLVPAGQTPYGDSGDSGDSSRPVEAPRLRCAFAHARHLMIRSYRRAPARRIEAQRRPHVEGGRCR